MVSVFYKELFFLSSVQLVYAYKSSLLRPSQTLLLSALPWFGWKGGRSQLTRQPTKHPYAPGVLWAVFFDNYHYLKNYILSWDVSLKFKCHLSLSLSLSLSPPGCRSNRCNTASGCIEDKDDECPTRRVQLNMELLSVHCKNRSIWIFQGKTHSPHAQ